MKPKIFHQFSTATNCLYGEKYKKRQTMQYENCNNCFKKYLSLTLLACRRSFSLCAFVAGSSLSSSALEQLQENKSWLLARVQSLCFTKHFMYNSQYLRDLFDPALLLEVELTRLPRRSLLLGLVSVLSGGSFRFPSKQTTKVKIY